MAHILPDTPPQSFPREVLRVFHALKALPDTFYIWHHLAPWLPEAPDFLVLHEDGRVLLVKVSSAAASQASTASQMLLLDDNRTPLGQTEAQVLKAFLDSFSFPKEQLLETLVVFPNIPDRYRPAVWNVEKATRPGSERKSYNEKQARGSGKHSFHLLRSILSGWKNSASASPRK